MRAQSGDKRHAALRLTLFCVVLFGLALGVWQAWNSDAYFFPFSPRYVMNRSSVLHYPHNTPPTWYDDPGQFRDAGNKVVPTSGAVHLNATLIRGESTAQTVAIPPGQGLLASNIAASVNLVSVHGLRVAGRTAGGFLALERPRDKSHTVRLTVGRAQTTPMRLGPVISLLGALGLACVLITSIWLPRRRGPRRAAFYY